jgi:hypothetical protein
MYILFIVHFFKIKYRTNMHCLCTAYVHHPVVLSNEITLYSLLGTNFFFVEMLINLNFKLAVTK